jgi:catechol 2,3-dioxygenase-like lactoylglutathione lyase family enzyme
LTVIPVSDVDRAKEFYADQLGFNVDVDHRAGESFRVVQMTPPGSAASITIGTGVSQAEPGSYEGMHLVVEDLVAACRLLEERGVEVIEPFHFGPEGRADGLHPDRLSYGSFASFADPDGNTWLIQEVTERRLGHDEPQQRAHGVECRVRRRAPDGSGADRRLLMAERKAKPKPKRSSPRPEKPPASRAQRVARGAGRRGRR